MCNGPIQNPLPWLELNYHNMYFIHKNSKLAISELTKKELQFILATRKNHE